jgi:hypothetical protein
LSVDPLASLTRAPYNYAYDNPVNVSDPTGLGCGLDSLSWGSCATKVVGAVADFTEHHYGQIAEGIALGACVGTEIGAFACLAATGAGFTASTAQNATNPGGFSPAAEALDVLGTLPGLQVAAADYFGLFGAGVGQTVTKALTTYVGVGAITFESSAEEAAAYACGP